MRSSALRHAPHPTIYHTDSADEMKKGGHPAAPLGTQYSQLGTSSFPSTSPPRAHNHSPSHTRSQFFPALFDLVSAPAPAGAAPARSAPPAHSDRPSAPPGASPLDPWPAATRCISPPVPLPARS